MLLKRRYEGSAAEVSSLERRAVGDIVAALNVGLTAADHERLRRVPACRDDAYADFVEGRGLLDRKDIPGNIAKAEQAFSRAVTRDPRCAPAFLGLADARWAAYQDQGADAGLVERAREALDAAAALDADSVSIKRAYAVLYLGTRRAEQAEQAILDVIEHRPFDDEAHRLRAEILGLQGRTEEALNALRQAVTPAAQQRRESPGARERSPQGGAFQGRHRHVCPRPADPARQRVAEVEPGSGL